MAPTGIHDAPFGLSWISAGLTSGDLASYFLKRYLVVKFKSVIGRLRFMNGNTMMGICL
jgi:hypothetical protein